MEHEDFECLHDWLHNHDRLLSLYTVFFAWYRRLLIQRYFRLWRIRMLQLRPFHRIIPMIRDGIHTPHLRTILDREDNLPNRQHYTFLAVDYEMQRFHGISHNDIVYHPTPAIHILIDLVDLRYIVLPRH